MPDEKGNSTRSIYIIFDLVAETFIGQCIIDRHAAPVTRIFHSLLGDKNTQLGQHPNDYNLIFIGYIEDNGQLWPVTPTIVATGSAWLAAQNQEAA